MSHPIETPSPQVTVILPCLNEVDNIEPMIAELQEVLEPTGRTYEILYVDDRSTDGTYEKLVGLLPVHSFLRVIRHRVNLGQSAALVSGYKSARGEILVSMDADLQNDPHDLPRMLEKLDEGFDAVCGVRTGRKDSFGKKISSKVANSIRSLILGDGILDAGCTYRAMRRHCADELPVFRATHRFTNTLLTWNGYKIHQLPIGHRSRTHGVSKYGIGNRLWVGIKDMLAMRWYKGRRIPPQRLEPEPRPTHPVH
jgi:dolichol-phosphate mannosyltransferase